MSDVAELINRIRTNIDMAQLHGSVYFDEARRLLMNDLVEAIDELRYKQRGKLTFIAPSSERETPISVTGAEIASRIAE